MVMPSKKYKSGVLKTWMYRIWKIGVLFQMPGVQVLGHSPLLSLLLGLSLLKQFSKYKAT